MDCYNSFTRLYLEAVEEIKILTKPTQVDNPFQLDHEKFIEYFLIDKNSAKHLCEQMLEALYLQSPRKLGVNAKVLTALRFYATGDYQDPVYEQFGLAVTDLDVNRCVRMVSEFINEILFQSWVHFPVSIEERETAKLNFVNSADPFPGTIGVLDCTYVHIVGPKTETDLFINPLGDYTINVQLVCDSNYKIIFVNALCPGGLHDAAIWRNSACRDFMKKIYSRGEQTTWLIGDSAFPLEPWLMTPLKNEIPGSSRYQYNELLCNAHSVIGKCLEILKSNFRCISSQRVLRFKPEEAGKIINACCVLHNMRIANNIVTDPNKIAKEEPVPGREYTIAQSIQDELISSFTENTNVFYDVEDFEWF